MYTIDSNPEIISHIIECMCLRLKEKEALSRLQEQGFKISPATFYRLKNEVRDSTQSRLHSIGLDFMAMHLARLDNLNTIHNELWEQYKRESNPTKKANILMQIAEMQIYISSYHDSTKYVLESSVKLDNNELAGNKKKRKKLLINDEYQ